MDLVQNYFRTVVIILYNIKSFYIINNHTIYNTQDYHDATTQCHCQNTTSCDLLSMP